MSTGHDTITVTKDQVVIDGIDVTDQVTVIDGRVQCEHCDHPVEDKFDLDTYRCWNGITYVGHHHCMTEMWIED
jgi:hypothetical protein